MGQLFQHPGRKGGKAVMDVPLSKHGLAPLLDLLFLHSAFQEERIRPGERLSSSSAAKGRHISAFRASRRDQLLRSHRAQGTEREMPYAEDRCNDLVSRLSSAAPNYCIQRVVPSFQQKPLQYSIS